MAEITVKCVKEFYDKENKIKRKTGDIFVVTEERAAQIREYESSADKKYIEEIQNPPAEETPEQSQDSAPEQTTEAIQNPLAEKVPLQTTEDNAEQPDSNTATKATKKAKKAAGDES